MKVGRQTTLGARATVSGIGVHSGLPVTLTLHPADAGTGVVFVRLDAEKARAEDQLCIGIDEHLQEPAGFAALVGPADARHWTRSDQRLFARLAMRILETVAVCLHKWATGFFASETNYTLCAITRHRNRTLCIFYKSSPNH